MVNGNYNPHDEDFEQYDEGYSQADLERDMIVGAGDEALLADLPAPNAFLGVKPIEKEELEKPDFSQPTVEAEEQTEAEPYERTTKATEDAYKSWRKMMMENYEKRKAENKKRVRDAQIVGLGKALGDLVAGIWGGVSSLKNNAPAIVPARQSSRTSEQIEKLINEGVVNSRDYDTMLQNLAMQEDKDKINLAKAYDELGIKQKQLAEQRSYEELKMAKAHERELEKIAKRGEWQQTLATLKSDLQSAREAKKAENAVQLAKIKGRIQERIKQLGGVGNLDWFTYESLQELFPGEADFATTTTGNDKYGIPQTKTVSGTRPMPQGTAQAKMTAKENERFAKSVGLNIEEAKYITPLRSMITQGRFTEEEMNKMIAQARKEGKSVADLIKLLNP